MRGSSLPPPETRSHAACRRRDDRLVQPRRHVLVTGQPRWQRRALAREQRREPAYPARPRGAVTDAVFSPGGKLLATASSSGATGVWYTDSGTRSALLLGHATAVNHVSFTRDAQFLVTAGADGTARIWRTRNGGELTVLRGPPDSAFAAAVFSPDGRTVVDGGLGRRRAALGRNPTFARSRSAGTCPAPHRSAPTAGSSSRRAMTARRGSSRLEDGSFACFVIRPPFEAQRSVPTAGSSSPTTPGASFASGTPRQAPSSAVGATPRLGR